MTEWEVWLGDGSRLTSQTCAWADVPDNQILVVRWWRRDANGALQGGTNWGDSIYGHPETWKGGVIVADDVFQRVLAEAHATTVPPSAR